MHVTAFFSAIFSPVEHDIAKFLLRETNSTSIACVMLLDNLHDKA